MIENQLYIGIDGLIELAKRHGLESYTTAIGPGADGLECVAVLHWKDRDTDFRATRNEAILDGGGTSKVWNDNRRVYVDMYKTNTINSSAYVMHRMCLQEHLVRVLVFDSQYSL